VANLWISRQKYLVFQNNHPEFCKNSDENIEAGKLPLHCSADDLDFPLICPILDAVVF
jgi:hypothetical protein